MSKKYELTNETRRKGNTILYRIRSLKDFNNVKKGELGGFIESESNLSHDGDACVSGNARIFRNAWISDNARVFGDVHISGNSCVSGE